MNPESQQARLAELAAKARGRSAQVTAELAPRAGMAPGPADLFVLAATAELPVEWAILERGAGGELLAVPADASPLVGTGDVEVSAGSAGGPLVLRCRFAVWLAPAVFDPALRTGVLAAAAVAEALHRRRQIETGELEASPLAEEVEADPEYQDWLREVPARARELASKPSPPRIVSQTRFRPSRTAERLAAVLALVALGLSLWVLQLRREVDRLSAPIFGVPAEEVSLGGAVRGDNVIRLPAGASHVILILAVDPSLPAQDGRLEIADASGAVLWRSAPLHLLPSDERRLIVRRKLLVDGEYSVRIVPRAGKAPVIEERVKVETER